MLGKIAVPLGILIPIMLWLLDHYKDKVHVPMWLIILLSIIAGLAVIYILYLILVFTRRLAMRIRFRSPITLTPEAKTPKSSKETIPTRNEGSILEISRGIEFYPDRASVDKVYGGLQNELKGVANAWVSWASGTYYNLIDDKLREKITQIIFVNPDSELLKQLAKKDTRSHGELVTEINKAVAIAKTKNTQIVYSDKPILYGIIGDPLTDNAWARLQMYLPNTDSPKWFNIVIHKKDAPEEFGKVKEAYSGLFAELKR